MSNEATVEKTPRKNWIKGLVSEFKKIVWPDRMSVIKQTVAVAVISVILGAIIKVLDMGILALLDFLF